MDRLRSTASDVRQSMHAQTVFGEPVTHNGITVLPAARTRGGFGGGGGGGEGEEGEGSGMGMGYGVSSRPIGAFVISDDQVTWKPSIDVNLMFMMGCAVAALYFFFAWLDD
jgi:uncharacterized spore protein YtfJ